MDSPLTGRPAAEALQAYVGLAAQGNRFDGRRVAIAVRSRVGRMKLRAALLTARVRMRRPAVLSVLARPRETRCKAFSRHGSLNAHADPPRLSEPLGAV